MIKREITLGFIALIITLSLDFVWLGFVARNFYLTCFQAANLLPKEASSFNVKKLSAALVWIIMVAGNYIFCVYPSIKSNNNYSEFFLKGFLYGFFIYATYNLTNHATITAWPLRLVIIDTIWGSFLNGFVAMTTNWLKIIFLAKK